MGEIITVPRRLRDRLGEDGADDLIGLLNQIGASQQAEVLALADARFAKTLAEVGAALELKIADSKNDLELKLAENRADLEVKMAESRADLVAVKSGLEVKIAQSESRLIKWMFIFWIGQVAATLAIVSLLFFRS